MLKYNGWSNYVTWKMNLEFVDEQLNHYYEVAPRTKDPAVMAEFLQREWELYVEHISDQLGNDQCVLMSFVDCYVEDVNWYEIAEHVIEGRP